MFAYEVLDRPDSVLAAYDRDDSASEPADSEIEASEDIDESIGMAGIEEPTKAGDPIRDEISTSFGRTEKLEETVDVEDSNAIAQAGPSSKHATQGSSKRAGPTSESFRRGSPPWKLHEHVEQSLVIDSNGIKRSTRINPEIDRSKSDKRS